MNEESLPLPEFTKVKYRTWQLDQMNPSQAQSATSHFLTDELGIEVSGTATSYYYLPKYLVAQGVLLTNINTAQSRYPQQLDKLLGQVIANNTDRLTAQNAQKFNTGILLYVPDHTVIKDVIHLNLNQLSVGGNDYIARVLVYVGRQSSVTILQSAHTIGSDTTKASLVVEVIADVGASVHYANLDAFSGKTTAYIHREADIRDHATLDWSNVAFNDGQVVTKLVSHLNGEGAVSHANIMAMTHHKQTQGFMTNMVNRGRHSLGHIYQRGVILNHSTLVFNGIGQIIKGARGSDAQQESRVLMLSRRARGDANPLLLIDENDVTAGHAASVGRVDENQMYYLMSRGLSEKLARELVIRGFMGNVLAEIPTNRAQQAVINAIAEKLKNEN